MHMITMSVWNGMNTHNLNRATYFIIVRVISVIYTLGGTNNQSSLPGITILGLLWINLFSFVSVSFSYFFYQTIWWPVEVFKINYKNL